MWVIHAAMRKLVYFAATSVDGFIASPTGDFSHFPMGEHVTAQADELPETLPVHVREMFGAGDQPKRFGAVIMGRATYTPALNAGVDNPYAPLETVVFSRTLPAQHTGNLRITAEDPRQVVAAMKRADGRDIWLCGGGHLAGQLAGDIDEWHVKVNPMVTGSGIPLAAMAFEPRALTLRDVRQFDSGVVWLRYDTAQG